MNNDFIYPRSRLTKLLIFSDNSIKYSKYTYRYNIIKKIIIIISKIVLRSQFIKIINGLMDYNKQRFMLGIQHQKGINQNKYFKKIHVNSQENII